MFNINKKKWENFWYYYKIHVGVGIFVAIFLGMTIKDCVQNIEPDVTLVYMGMDLQPNHITHMEEEFLEILQDANNDGKKQISVLPVTNEQKLQLLVITRNAQLLILDRSTFEAYARLGAFQPLDIFIEPYQINLAAHPEIQLIPQEEQEKHVYGIPLEGNDFFEKMGLAASDKYLVMVAPGGKSSSKETAIYQNAFAVLEKIMEP
jgi:hypothetical protein